MMKIIKFIFVFFSLIILSSSCVRYRSLVMLDSKLGTYDTTKQDAVPVYKIQKSDVIDISVASTDAQSLTIFTKGQSESKTIDEGMLYFNGYVVDDSGKVSMPIIGDVYVEGKTVSEIRDTLQKRMYKYYKYATVSVKLAIFRVSVLGEVLNPGTQLIYRDRINILEVLTMSGGFKDLANRKEVKIIRTINGVTEIRIVDLTSEKLLNDPWYQLMPNDIIYIKPLKYIAFKTNVATITTTVSVLSLMLIIINFTR
jgi:polysaccharide biosynthesis/export protein